jgi:hypothetical protein
MGRSEFRFAMKGLSIHSMRSDRCVQCLTRRPVFSRLSNTARMMGIGNQNGNGECRGLALDVHHSSEYDVRSASGVGQFAARTPHSPRWLFVDASKHTDCLWSGRVNHRESNCGKIHRTGKICVHQSQKEGSRDQPTSYSIRASPQSRRFMGLYLLEVLSNRGNGAAGRETLQS